ncbi:TetR/AcrR family transcriptional regulator [Niallia taxi]|uniref:TetR/AcrR family transcriptional regulator n=1 Tax=Niallia taxi TaxID=2499688 RepID=UPI003D27CAEE
MNSNSKRELLLLATAKIINEVGANNLTLEAVAKEAGVSKGGLLHHFPNKQSLLKSMVEEATNVLQDEILQRVSNDENSIGKWTRGYLGTVEEKNGDDNGIDAAMIATLLLDPDLLRSYQEKYDFIKDNIENDGIDPIEANIVRLAIDGLWLGEIFGLGNLDDNIRTNILGRLHEISLKTNKEN